MTELMCSGLQHTVRYDSVKSRKYRQVMLGGRQESGRAVEGFAALCQETASFLYVGEIIEKPEEWKLPRQIWGSI